MATFLENFRNALLAAEVGLRIPSVAGEGHPLWLEPRGGAIAPGESGPDAIENDEDLVVSAFKFPGLSTVAHEGDTYRYDNIELRIRAWKPPAAYELESLIRAVLHDRRNWDMGELRIIESMVFTELTPIDNDAELGFTFRQEYSFQRYLTDQP